MELFKDIVAIAFVAIVGLGLFLGFAVPVMVAGEAPEVVEAPAEMQDAPVVTVEEAIKVLQADQMAKMKACEDEVNEVLKRHGCVLTVVTEIRVVPNPNQEARK